MVKDEKGVSLVILGVVSVIAVIGLVMMFSGNSIHGAEFTNVKDCDSPCTMVIAGTAAEEAKFLTEWTNLGYSYAGDTEFTYAGGEKRVVPCVCPPQGPLKATVQPNTVHNIRDVNVPVKT